MGGFDARLDADGVLWVTGELDVAAVDPFSAAATAAVDGQREFVIDMTELTFIDSSGIRAVTRLATDTDRPIVLRNLQRSVRRVIDITAIAGRHGIRVEG